MDRWYDKALVRTHRPAKRRCRVWVLRGAEPDGGRLTFPQEGRSALREAQREIVNWSEK
jgi:hypothetical protein